jgi:hypothetical protein
VAKSKDKNGNASSMNEKIRNGNKMLTVGLKIKRPWKRLKLLSEYIKPHHRTSGCKLCVGLNWPKT